MRIYKVVAEGTLKDTTFTITFRATSMSDALAKVTDKYPDIKLISIHKL